MTEPTAPQIPNDAPQDVKDFFDCKGDKLEWKPGKVTWLGLPVDPTVDFAHGQPPAGVNINVTVGAPPFGATFTLPASVNAAGELEVDSSSVPDLSGLGLGGRADVDAAIKRINDWFKHNGKKLKPAKLKGGVVTLEKTPLAVAPGQAVPAVPVVPVTPVAPPPPKPKPVAPPPPATSESSGGGCSLPFLMLLILFGVIVIGGGIGFVYFGDPGPVAQATATPTPRSTATLSPASTPTSSPIMSASPIPSTSPSSSPVATVTATPLPIFGEFTAVCIKVVHDSIGEFVSYLDWFVYWAGGNVEYFEVTVVGANNGQPQTLEFESRSQAYEGVLGLHEAGDKRIVSVIAHMSDGSEIDLTEDLIDEFGSDEFTVRFPQEDSLGSCPF